MPLKLDCTEFQDDRLFIRQKQSAIAKIDKEIKRSKKRLEACLQTLETCRNWEAVHHEGLLLQSNLFRLVKGMKEIALADWKDENKERIITLDPLLPPQDQVAALFRRSKKLRKGEIHAERMVGLAEQGLQALLEQKAALESVSGLEGLHEYFTKYLIGNRSASKPLTSKAQEPAKPYKVFTSEAGIEIWVGKSAKDNDKLSFHYAHGLDPWLHARNYPGSHVVIRCPKGQEVDPETLHDAAELALRFSKAKDSGCGEVTLTQAKDLRRVPGTPGKVMLSRHKTLKITLSEKRWDRLRSRPSSINTG